MTPAEIEDRVHEGMARRAAGEDRVTLRMARVLQLSHATRVLDVAAGVGLSAPLLARELGTRVVAVDRDASSLDRIAFAARQAGVEDLVQLVHGDETALELPPATFDAAICEGAVERLGGPLAFLHQVAPLVRPGCGIAFTALCRTRFPLPPDSESALGTLRWPREVLIDFVRAGCEPLGAEAMDGRILAEHAARLGSNAADILGRRGPAELLEAARQAERAAAALREAGDAIASVLFVGRRLEATGLSPGFSRHHRA